MLNRNLGPEAAGGFDRRVREGFFEKYLSGQHILDIGFRGEVPDAEPITANAIGVELDYPGYDGRTLPFADFSQDSVFASHILEHIDGPQEAIADWYRVLRVGGYLIIAVPHRWLYERKAAPPSRFNPDHKRFYTAASLLAEVEEALPTAGYRIRLLKDVDDGFDYTIPPERHATGSYEIELVIQKIALPSYAHELEIDDLAERDLTTAYAQFLKRALWYQERNRDEDLRKIMELLSALPMPPFVQLVEVLDAPWRRPKDAHAVFSRFGAILKLLVARVAFDEAWYLARHPGIAQAVAEGNQSSGHGHYIHHGYFEGREARLHPSGEAPK